MDYKCENCKFFRKMYVPPIRMYKDIPQDAYVCGLFYDDDEVMYLGTDEQGAKLGMCEEFVAKIIQ